MKWVPRVEYNGGVDTLNFTQPQKIWVPMARSIGGSDMSDSGTPEAYIIRRDQLCRTEIRFLESEWVDVDTWLEAVQTGQPFDWWFDQSDDSTKYNVYLDTPKLGDGEVEPERDDYTRIFTLPITIRTVDGSRFDVRIFN